MAKNGDGIIRTILRALDGPPEKEQTPPNHMATVFNRTSWGYQRTRPSDVAAAMKEWAYACIDRRAKAVAMADYEINGVIGERETILPMGHWAQRLWENPNPMMERYEIRTLASKYKDLYGNSFLYMPLRKDANGQEYPYQVWPLPSAQVQVVMNAQGTRKLGYIWNSDMAGQIYLSAKEVLHLRSMEPSINVMNSLFVGTPKINACIDAIRTSSEVKEYLREYFANDAIPPLVLTSDGNIDDEQFANLKKRWNDKFPQHMIAGALEGGMKIQPVTRDGLGVVDKKDTAAIGEDNIRIICSVFGLNVGLLTGDYSERSTAEVQRDLFMQVTVKAELQYMDDAITRHFRQFDPCVRFRHKVDAYVDPEEARAQEEFDFQHGLITRNDMLKRRGLDPVPDGDVYYLAPSVLTVEQVTNPNAAVAATVADDGGEVPTDLAGTAQMQGESKGVSVAPVQKYDIVEVTALDSAGDDEEDGPLPASLNDPEMMRVWKDISDTAAPFEKTIERGVANVFLDLGEEVVANMKRAANAKAGGTKAWIAKAVDGSAPLFDVSAWQKKLAAKLSPDAARLITKMMEKAITSVGMNWAEIVSSLDLESQKVLQTSLNKIKETVPTIDKELRGFLQKNSDLELDTLTDMVNQKFANIYGTSRANAIARTTVTFTTNASQKAAWNKVGFSRRMWITQRDGDVRYKHRMADGQICDTAGMFMVAGESTDHPCGDGLSAGNAVNCRCYTKVATEKEMQAAGVV